MRSRNDMDALAGYIATLVASVSLQAAKSMLGGPGDKSTDKTSGAAARRPATPGGTPAKGKEEASILDLWPADPVDGPPVVQEKVLEDGRVHKSYQDGTTRIENPKSGVIQEERPDGSLLVSLPDGKLLYQEYPSDPMLAYDLSNSSAPPKPAGVAMVSLPDQPGATPVYHFSDSQGTHLVGLDSLRYYRLQQPATAVR